MELMNCKPGFVGQRGIALVLVLWVIALLTVMAAAMTMAGRTNSGLTHNLLQQGKARWLIEAGVNYGVLKLLDKTPGKPWTPDGTPFPWQFDGVELLITVRDERALIDLNKADNGLLLGLLKATGVEDSEPLVDAILDWRDKDQNHRLKGAEDPAYEDAGLGYGAGDGNFNSIEELQLVLGMTPEYYRALEPALTVRSGQRTVMAASASPLVLSALPGMTPGRLEDFLELREQYRAEGRGNETPLPAGVSSGKATTSGGRKYRIQVDVPLDEGRYYSGQAEITLGAGGRGGFKIEGWRLGIGMPETKQN